MLDNKYIKDANEEFKMKDKNILIKIIIQYLILIIIPIFFTYILQINKLINNPIEEYLFYSVGISGFILAIIIYLIIKNTFISLFIALLIKYIFIYIIYFYLYNIFLFI